MTSLAGPGVPQQPRRSVPNLGNLQTRRISSLSIGSKSTINMPLSRKPDRTLLREITPGFPLLGMTGASATPKGEMEYI